MNPPNLLQKLAIAGVSTAIAATTIAVAPAQAQIITGTLEWNNGTTNFNPITVDGVFQDFDVTFSPGEGSEPDLGGQASVFIATGVFAPYFTDLPAFFPINGGAGATGSFEFVEETGGPGAQEAIYELDGSLEFDFGNGVTATLPDGAEFLAIVEEDEADELALLGGEGSEWIFSVPEVGTFTADDSVFEFGDLTGDAGGTYTAEGEISDVPEPASMLGILAVGGLGLATRRKKAQK